MNFTSIFIRRPIFATVLSLLLLLIGLRSYIDLPVQQFPLIQASVINVSTAYPGASAHLMEGFVTTPIESALAGIEGLDFITSSSSQNVSSINIQFKLGYDINKAITDVSNAVASVRESLPKEINDPVIAKDNTNANPVIFIGFDSAQMTPEQVTDYLVRVVQPQLGAIPGVAQARVLTQKLYAMRIWLDPDKMAAHQITADDIHQALSSNNVQSAAGQLHGRWQVLNVDASTALTSAEQFNNIVIKNENGYLLRLKDVGHAVLGAQSIDQVSANIDGKATTVMGIVPQTAANPLEISAAITHLMPVIKQQLLAGMHANVLWDSSKFIAASIKEVYHTIIEAAICVIIVIFCFLGSIRAVFIPLVTIPLSLIGVCGLMLALGYTINTLTLLAWVFAIGLVVDDAIVVLENIHRHIEDGMEPLNAALQGAKEIGFAVVAMTLTLAAVYAPIGFMAGFTGILFRQFAFTLAGSVLISGFIALTLTPMMCSKLLKHEAKASLSHRIDAIFNRLVTVYGRALSWVVDKRLLVVIAAALVYISCYFLYQSLPAELAPKEDQGVIFGIVIGPSSANLAYTEKYTQQLANIYQSLPETAGYGVINGYPNGVSSAFSFLVLKPWQERHRNAEQIIGELFPKLWMIPGVLAFPFNPPPLPGSNSNASVGFVLKTIGDYQSLYQAEQTLLAAVANNPHFVNVNSDLKFDTLQLQLELDRNKASDLGISAQTIANTLNLLLGEPTITRFVMNGRSYEVIPQLAADFRTNPQQLNLINVRTARGDLVPFANLVQLKTISGPQSLNHFQQLHAAKLEASLTPDYSLGEALKFLENVVHTQLSKQFSYDFAGESRQFVESSGAMMQTFIFALLFIFLVLAAQFESFRNPLIVMLSVPLSLAGALVAMHLTQASINIYTEIGLVTLVGLISKHGILIVEFAEQMQAQGKSLKAAVIAAASMRLRPILMTTAAMVLGALPLAMATGAGAEARRQIGWVIMGGMSFGTCLTLFIVPTAYLLIAKARHN